MVFTGSVELLLTLLVFSVVAQDAEVDVPDGPELENLKISLEDFRYCEGTEDLPLGYHNVSLEMVGRAQVAIAGMYTANKVVGQNNDYKVKIDLTRCDSKQQADSCQHFASKTVNLCDHLSEENKIWSPLVEKTQGFQPNCPLDTGTFVVDNAQIELGDMENMPMCLGYWKIDVMGTDDGEDVFCTHAEFQISAKRKKKN